MKKMFEPLASNKAAMLEPTTMEVAAAPPPTYEASLAADPSQRTQSTSSDSKASHRRRSSPAMNQRLEKPIAIPATDGTWTSPFLRAYPPCLHQYALPEEIFLKMIDDLNRVASENQPLQALGVVGDAVTYVPLPIIPLLGGILSAGAGSAAAGISSGRVNSYIKTANRDVFGPRGLKAEILKTTELARVAGIPILDAKGKINKEASLLPPLEEISEVQSLAGQQRRLRAFEQWIAPVEISASPIQAPSNTISKWNLKLSEHKRKRDGKPTHSSRQEQHAKYINDKTEIGREFDREMDALDFEKQKLIGNPNKYDSEKLERKSAQIQQERQRLRFEFSQKMNTLERQHVKDDYEEKTVKKLYWLVITEL